MALNVNTFRRQAGPGEDVTAWRSAEKSNRRYLIGVHQLQGREDVLDGLGGRDQSLHWHSLDLVAEANQHTDFLGLLKSTAC